MSFPTLIAATRAPASRRVGELSDFACQKGPEKFQSRLSAHSYRPLCTAWYLLRLAKCYALCLWFVPGSALGANRIRKPISRSTPSLVTLAYLAEVCARLEDPDRAEQLYELLLR
jgi:hypothetical protein